MKPKYINLHGKKFERLLVIEHVSTNDRSATFWKCKCDCGNECTVRSSDLRKSKQKSCGCWKSDIVRRAKRSLPYQWLYYKLKFVATKSQREFNISYEDYLTFTQISTCYYCNEKVIWKPHSGEKYGGYNIDRKDNCKGYTKDNCVVCCSLCNHIKGNLLTEQEMLKLGPILAEIQKNRSSTS